MAVVMRLCIFIWLAKSRMWPLNLGDLPAKEVSFLSQEMNGTFVSHHKKREEWMTSERVKRLTCWNASI